MPALQILHLEDSRQDAELIHATLTEGKVDCQIRHVLGKEDFERALMKESFDIILADRSTPSYDGTRALARARELRPEIPFIFVSGTLDEELAIKLLTEGATDYVLKHRLSRLVPAILRARDEVENRREKARLEEQLFQARKMESLGSLAGGVAHDFNNILTIIMAYSALLENAVGKPDQVKEISATLREASERGAGLVRQLLSFARNESHEMRETSVNEVIEALSPMLRATFPKTIDLVKNLQPGLPPIQADPGQIHQALLNLCINARDAMPDGGTLTLTTEVVSSPGNPATPCRVEISVSDTGCGMDDATRARIFDPFFTTKGKGRGTGLGLAVVYGVVQHHQGHVLVDSHPGKGTRFILSFVCPVVPQNAPDPVACEQVDDRGSETLLLVDDEPLILTVLSGVLSSKGYQTLTAGDGRQALEVFRQHHDRIDLVISDIGLPVMDGVQLAAEMRQVAPHIPVVLCSGYMEPSIQQSLQERGVAGFILKPFQSAVLLVKVRQALDFRKKSAAG